MAKTFFAKYFNLMARNTVACRLKKIIYTFSLDIVFLKNKTPSITTSFTCIGTQNYTGRFAYSFFDIVLYEMGTFCFAVCSEHVGGNLYISVQGILVSEARRGRRYLNGNLETSLIVQKTCIWYLKQ